MSDRFAAFAARASQLTGSYITFLLAGGVVLVWALTGPLFGFSETWQLVINTATTIVTFLMVFLIQNTQNRDAMAVHLKLDELIRSLDGADNRLMKAEDQTDDELVELKAKYAALCEEHEELERRAGVGHSPLS
jgi:low affinity Fe/Cu permease